MRAKQRFGCWRSLKAKVKMLTAATITPCDRKSSNHADHGRKTSEASSLELCERATKSNTASLGLPAEERARLPTTAPGEWLSFVWLKVPVESTPIYDILARVCARISKSDFSAHFHTTFNDSDRHKSELSSTDPGAPSILPPHLHISVTRPILIRAQEREELFQKVKDTLMELTMSSESQPKRIQGPSRRSTIPISFSRFSLLPSDTTHRVFLVLEIGKGHDDLLRISSALNESLRKNFRAPEYWLRSEVRFHASFGCFDLSDDRLESLLSDKRCWRRSELELELKDFSEAIERRYGNDLRQRVGQVRLTTVGVTVGKNTKWFSAPSL